MKSDRRVKSLLEKPKVIMNFTGIYDCLKEENASNCQSEREDGQTDEVISFKDISGTDGYCSDEAKEEIRSRIRSLPVDAVHYLDSGNYHYLSEFWLEKIEEPFQLAMFDHHTDMQPSALLPLTSCGNWLLESLDLNPNLKRVWLIGPPEESFMELSAEDRCRVTWFSEEEANSADIHRLMADFDPELPVYLSVDKDVLSEEVLSTNWDQGSMTLERMQEWVHFFAKAGSVIGLDLCGEEEGQDSLKVNEAIEQAVLVH